MSAKVFWSSLPLGRGVRVLAHDANGLAALAKPAGTLSHPNRRGEEMRSLLTIPYSIAGECYDQVDGMGSRLWLLNRLDSATSGVILVAANEQLAREVRAMFKARHVRKVYAALVFGVPAPARQVWRDRLVVQKSGGRIRAAGGGNVPAETWMQLAQGPAPGAHPPISLIELEPRTGRSHQLRTQCARRHLPIVGDATYGEFGLNREFARRTGQKRLFLHSLETRFEYEWEGRTHRFAARAPLPPEFTAALRG